MIRPPSSLRVFGALGFSDSSESHPKKSNEVDTSSSRTATLSSAWLKFSKEVTRTCSHLSQGTVLRGFLLRIGAQSLRRATRRVRLFSARGSASSSDADEIQRHETAAAVLLLDEVNASSMSRSQMVAPNELIFKS